ncbi:MAG: c-type cytochrome [Myxococcales bacterium]|nr:c-type cytochrome [Myxococcales bacterium]
MRSTIGLLRHVLLWAAYGAIAGTGCGDDDAVQDGGVPSMQADHGQIAEGISATMGDPLPTASEDQLEAFTRGERQAQRRFGRREGLGPAFNVTFCAACHERPTTGGSAPLYRNFSLTGVLTDDGAFFPGESAGTSGGVLRIYAYPRGEEPLPARPAIPPETNVFAVRNAIPFFGVGLLAELPEEEILKRADPDDEDGDGISGRPNYDRGFVGRFGLKAQTVSIEGFIRGPLFNHVGITTDPLSEEARARLPVDSSGGEESADARRLGALLQRHAQAAAPEEPLKDDDGVPDPEMGPDELFDLVSFVMLLAAPEVEDPGESERRGIAVFDRIGCPDCHTPRLEGPRGPLPVYSDLLLHDMGDALADGIVQKEATGREFRTQPLWGLSAVGPYLHDGRATSIAQAIAAHGGEASAARDAFVALDTEQRDWLLSFLESLGGRSQYSPGLLPPDEPAPQADDLGGPISGLSPQERERFMRGRALFDVDFGLDRGLGAPRFNGDSCRACHFEPVIGGAGPSGVNAMRHGRLDKQGRFVAPAIGTIIHRTSALLDTANKPETGTHIFEHRQTPPLFGLGLIDGIARAEIEAGADPDDADGDGISGRVSIVSRDRIGRFGWKAQVPTLAEFVRDAMGAELGITVPRDAERTFGILEDDDDVPDPELTLDDQNALADYLRYLAPPPRTPAEDPAQSERGKVLFGELGCVDCHTPELEGANGPVRLYSDLLLHDVLPGNALGIVDGSAGMREFRTPPLWGVGHSGPYMHTGAADTLSEAIADHDGEARPARKAFRALPKDDREALIVFLRTL